MSNQSVDGSSVLIKNKIPEYARDYKNEWLFIRGINKKCENFLINYLLDASELFVSSYSDKIKDYIRKFLKAQECGHLKDTSCFIFKECDVENIDFLFERMKSDFEEDEEFVDGHPEDYPGYRNFYELFCKFYDKINVGFSESESESESDIDINEILSDSDSDSDSD